MGCFTCGRNNVLGGSPWATGFAVLSRAAAKAAGARVRRTGLLATRVDWAERAAACERCHLRIVQAGVSYCGRPLLSQIARTPEIDGCGCPTREKAKDPGEHCPLSARNRPADESSRGCNCKWCELAART